MENITHSYEIAEITYSIDKYFTEETLMFDIECTGLSPRHAFVYLIGCAARMGNSVTITQFFAQNEYDEESVLRAFEEYVSGFTGLMGFNSTRFDASFLLERYRKYGIEAGFAKKPHIDMYLTVTKAKCLLDLPNYKQKTIEQYLGLNREDKYDGGQLIPIYKEYSKNNDMEARDLVLLHNLEDVKGMVYCCDIMAYSLIADVEFDNFSQEPISDKARFTLKLPFTLANAINKQRSYGLYIIKGDCATVTLNVTNSTLMTFLPDYKNYYYLIDEQIIIPKVLGQSISSDRKRNAKKQDCFAKADGYFIELPEKLAVPTNIRVFKTAYEDPRQFIPATDLTSGLACQILRFMLKH